MMKMRKHMGGVTLLELMIVVVIVAILAMVSYPNYREFAARAKRNEAKAALLRVATQQERFYLQNSRFANDLTELGYAAAVFITESDTYAVQITGADAANFTAEADYRPSDIEENRCNLFTIDGRGTKTSDPLNDCWTRTR